MKCFQVVLIFTCVWGALSAGLFTNDFDDEWNAWKIQYKKSYDADEEAMRRVIWQKNLEKIVRHNLQYERGLYTYRLGMNKFGDLTHEEFVSFFTGFKPSNISTKAGSTYLPPNNVEIPTSVDWRTKGYVTPVKDQGQCGSCWAFSATGSLEGQHFKATGNLVSLSEQNLVDCSGPEGNMGCDGGLMDQAFEYVKKKGIDTEASYPYKARDGKCKFSTKHIGANCTGYTDIKSGSEKHLTSAIATVGPISVAIDASQSSFQLYESGVYNEPDCSTTLLDHGVLAVGYGVTRDGTDYYIVKNSWGVSWGMKGYIWMSRNKDNQCGIATEASYPLV